MHGPKMLQDFDRSWQFGLHCQLRTSPNAVLSPSHSSLCPNLALMLFALFKNQTIFSRTIAGVSCISTSRSIHQQLDQPAVVGGVSVWGGSQILIRDWYAKCGTEVRAAIRSLKMNATDLIRKPVAESRRRDWVGNCRREVLDHALAATPSSLRSERFR